MRAYIPPDAFGLLPVPPILQVGGTDLPPELTGLIRELEDLLEDAKATDAATRTSPNFTQSPSAGANHERNQAPQSSAQDGACSSRARQDL
jgi:hypothetical protein